MSSAVAEERHDPPPPREESRTRRYGKGTWTLVVALVALAGSASSLVFTFLPELKPDPRDSVLAQLNVFAINPDVTLREYLKRRTAVGPVCQRTCLQRRARS